MNQYVFMVGSDGAHAATSGRTRVTVKEPGPRVASLVAESEAPGAARVSREAILSALFDHVALVTTIDKQRAPAGPKGEYYQPASKESVNLAFPVVLARPGGGPRACFRRCIARPRGGSAAAGCAKGRLRQFGGRSRPPLRVPLESAWH
jgi:hypothetical protein